MRKILYLVGILATFPTSSFAQMVLLESGFSSLERKIRSDIQCVLQEAGLYQGKIDGIYGPGTEAALFSGYAAIGSEGVRARRGGLNSDREVYYFLTGFTDTKHGYTTFADERRYCGLNGSAMESGANYSRSAENCGAQVDSNFTIFSDRIKFWESTCGITRRVEHGAGLIKLGLTCSGEGMNWTRQVEIRTLSDNRIEFEGTPYYLCQSDTQIPYGSRVGMNLTIVSESGIGTSNAKIIAKHLPANAREFCVGYAGDPSEECVDRVIERTQVNDVITANCESGHWTDAYGNQFELVGENFGSSFPEYVVRDTVRNETLDGSSASGYPTALAILGVICPGALERF